METDSERDSDCDNDIDSDIVVIVKVVVIVIDRTQDPKEVKSGHRTFSLSNLYK